MHKNVKIAIAGLIILALAAVFIYKPQQATIFAPNDFTACSIDSSKSIFPMPGKVLVSELPIWGPASLDYQNLNVEGKIFTPSTLRKTVVDYIVTYCAPSDSDYCVDQKKRAADYSNSAVSIAGSTFVTNDGLYWNNIKVFGANQQFKVILPQNHPELFDISSFNANTGYQYMRKYIGGFYGVTDAELLKCAPNYGITGTVTTTSVLMTTTTHSATTTTTMKTDLSNPIVPGLVAIIGISLYFYLSRRKK